MSLIKGLRRRPLIAIATVLAFLVSAGVAVWYSSRLPAKASAEDKQHLQNQLRKGIGSEVRFAARPEQADEAVASAADFIHWRSGLKLTDAFKKRLAKAETDVLNGKSPYITVNELTDDMTAAVVDRLATLTDEEIEAAAEASSDANGEVRSRADGKWGVRQS
jgi:epoxyqueuosine reductase QueG